MKMYPAIKLNMVMKAESYVRDLLQNELSNNLFYHDLRHTEQVVKAVSEITAALHMIPSEVEVITLAAWFHDTGYTVSNENHEEHSCAIALTFLKQEMYPEWFVEKVLQCIRAT
jgi:predicted metal-dependent HD superfamily phosphohydrolase